MIYMCPACKNHFCFDHLAQHRTDIEQGFTKLQNTHDEIRQQINDFKTDPTKHSLIKQIDQWEQKSINKIQQQAQLCRIKWINYSDKFLSNIEHKLNHLAKQMEDIQAKKTFNEIDLNDFKQKLEKLEKEFNQPTNVSIQQQSRLFIDKISLRLSSGKQSIEILLISEIFDVNRKISLFLFCSFNTPLFLFFAISFLFLRIIFFNKSLFRNLFIS